MERESIGARSRFFERDALLLRKHPKRYAELMRREAQENKSVFLTYFVNGIKFTGSEIPDEVLVMIPSAYVRNADGLAARQQQKGLTDPIVGLYYVGCSFPNLSPG